jgi:predicted permease
MLPNLLFSLEAVAPMFIVIFAGWWFKNKSVLSQQDAAVFNRFAFNVALPCSLFRDMANADLGNAFDVKLLGFSLFAVSCLYAAAWLLGKRFIRDRNKLGSFVQAAYRSNYVLMGTALLTTVYGSAEAGAMIIAVVVPIYNVFAVVVLGRYGGGEARVSVPDMLLNIIKNPLIIGIVLGVPFSLLQIEIPVFAAKALGYISQMALPMAFIAVGARISFNNIFTPLSLWAAAIKLVIAPLIFVPLALWIGLRGEALLAFYVLMASPTAVSTYPMACSMGCDEKTAANSVFVSTLLAVLTFTLGVYILKSAGLL